MTGAFWLRLAERTGRTFLQGFIASGVFGGGTFSIQNLKVGAGAGLVAVLMGLAAAKVGDPDSPSFLPAAIGGATGAAVGRAIGSTVGGTLGGVTGALGDLAKDLGEATGLDKGNAKRED